MSCPPYTQMRYNRFIAPLLNCYERPFSLFDFGAGDGENSQMTAERYPQSAVISASTSLRWEPKPGSKVLAMAHRFAFADLCAWHRYEHFDVTLAMNVLHHFAHGEWTDVLCALMEISTYIVVQTPHRDDSACGDTFPAIHNWMENLRGGEVCGYLGEIEQFPHHRPRPVYLLGPFAPTAGKFIVESDFEHKTISITRAGQPPREFRSWIHGMNLWNWRNYGGCWPGLEHVLDLLRRFELPQRNHGDVTPWNFVFDGAELHLVDGYEPGMQWDDKVCMQNVLHQMETGRQ